jgi:hypothetical protein
MSERYDRLPCKPVKEKPFGVRLSASGPGTSTQHRALYDGNGQNASQRLWKTPQDIYGRIEDGRQSRICYRQRRAQDQEKSSTSKHGVQLWCAIEAIESEKNIRHKIVIITDSLSTIMAAENRTPAKNLKTQTIRKMLDHEGPRITLLWALSHKGIPGNEKANQAEKEALDENISTTEKYPPDDLKKWLTKDDFKKRDQRWKNGNNEMKERKPDVNIKEDTK